MRLGICIQSFHSSRRSPPLLLALCYRSCRIDGEGVGPQSDPIEYSTCHQTSGHLFSHLIQRQKEAQEARTLLWLFIIEPNLQLMALP